MLMCGSVIIDFSRSSAFLSPEKRARFDEATERGLIRPADIAAEIQAGIPTPEASFMEKATGAVPTIASAIVAEPIAGLAGLASVPFKGAEAGEVVDNVRQAITLDPSTEEGRQGLIAIANNPAIKFLTEIDEKAKKIGGETGFDLAGPIGGAIGESLPTILESALGLKAIQTSGKAASTVGAAAETATVKAADAIADVPGQVKQAVSDVGTNVKNQLPSRKKAKELIESGEVSDSRTAQFILNDKGKIEADPFAQESIKQGFDKGTVAAIKGASASTRKKMLDMVNTMERGLNNARYSVLNRASDVIGESLGTRFGVVYKANRGAGKRLDGEAQKLRGQQVDVSEPVDNFLNDLESMGIQFDPSTRKVDFSGSDIEGLSGPQAAVKNIINRMINTKSPDAYDVHRLKKFIDENVTFGKSATGLGGKTETILKGLRHDLDAMLDTNFPDYNKVNIEYAETRGVIDAFQDAAGKKINLTGPNAEKAVGTLSRRLMSNAQSRANLLNSINDMDKLAKKYSGKGPLPVTLDDVLNLPNSKFDDDIITQVLFADELDKVFGSSSRTSLQGDIQKAVSTAGRATRSPTEAAVDVAGAGLEKLRGINEEGALKAIKDLLK